ncbi:hypothetical protein SteCoe_18640 [Stentor coeruleus]|uniref:Uncharacterized protein n=1 Tax=Stentor coeruleus TaxID=5963 RepID=A0A1R2BW76_9CILI|nr:hypothetical protein SteCoe_18640 [Stentor coeruleus]
MAKNTKITRLPDEHFPPNPPKGQGYSMRLKKNPGCYTTTSKSMCDKIMNFNKNTPLASYDKAREGKKIQDEDSLNFSEISEKEKLEQDTCGMITQEEILQKIDISDNVLNKSNLEDTVQRHVEKYERAFSLLQEGFFKYQEDTDKKLLKLHDQVAEIKTSIKHQDNYQTKLQKTISKALSSTKLSLSKQISSYLSSFPTTYSSTPIQYSTPLSSIQQKRESYDLQLKENEKYIQALQKNNQEMRSKSTFRNYSYLAEENQQLKSQLSKIMNNA